TAYPVILALHSYPTRRSSDLYLEKALQLKPDYPEARLNLGMALLKMNRISDAANHLNEALRLRPNYAEAHDALGVALYNSRNLRSEEHTSELQSRGHLVCRLL